MKQKFERRLERTITAHWVIDRAEPMARSVLAIIRDPDDAKFFAASVMTNRPKTTIVSAPVGADLFLSK